MAQVSVSVIDDDAASIEFLHPDAVRPLLGATLGREGARRVADLFGVLADPSRARIVHLLALSSEELCVCDIALVLGMTVSALSHQLRHLRERSVVARRRDGRLMFYRLDDDHLRQLIVGAAVHVAEPG